MKKVLLIPIICLSLFSFMPVLAECQNNTNCQYGSSPDLNFCYKSNNTDPNGIRYFCGGVSAYCGSNCTANNYANTTSGCFTTNYIDHNGNHYYCPGYLNAPNCNSSRTCDCSSNSGSSVVNNGVIINVGTGGNLYINLSPAEREAYRNNYRKFTLNGQGVYSRDLRKIPIGIIHMYGEDTDKDGLPNAFEWAVGTDPFNFNTDGDRYSDKTEIMGGYNPNGAGKMAFDKNLANRLKGKVLIQADHSGEMWFLNPTDGKRYYIGNEFDAMEIAKKFKVYL
jgi:hypothetical protein